MKSEQELNELICGDEETKEYVYKNVPYIGKKIEEIVQLKTEFDFKMAELQRDISLVLEMKENE